MSGPAFWAMLSGWLAFAVHVIWIHRDALEAWLMHVIVGRHDDDPAPLPDPPSHVRLVWSADDRPREIA